MEIDENELWILSYYGVSGLAGALVLGRLASQVETTTCGFALPSTAPRMRARPGFGMLEVESLDLAAIVSRIEERLGVDSRLRTWSGSTRSTI